MSRRADRQQLRRAERAVARMSEIERAVFLAIRIDGASYAEVADELDISVADVERHFASSLAILMSANTAKDPWWSRFWRR